jgi:hypothetical protein
MADRYLLQFQTLHGKKAMEVNETRMQTGSPGGRAGLRF